jgi:hypothetical protein
MHIAASGRTEIPLLDFQAAGGIGFEVRVIASQAILADAMIARSKVRNRDTGVITAIAPDELRSGKGISAAEEGGFRERLIHPSGFQSGEVCHRELLANQMRKGRKAVRRMAVEGIDVSGRMSVFRISFRVYMR